jgi:large subunit ribosomal protein L18
VNKMATNKRYTLAYKRKRSGKTDYKLRLNLLRSGKTRCVIRSTNTKYLVQFINYSADGDNVLVTVGSDELKKFGWSLSGKNTSAAYLVGYLAGKRALKADIKEAILDLGLQTSRKGSKVFAALKGALDAGLSIPHSDGIYPSEDRIKGTHVKNYVAENKDNFTKVAADAAKMDSKFDEVKAKIDSE